MVLGKKKLYDALRPLGYLANQQVVAQFRDHVLLVGRDNKLDLSTADFTSSLRVSLPCDGGDFSACLPAGPLVDFVRPADRADGEGVVELKAVENGQVVIAVEGATITLPSLPVDAFPAWPVDAESRMKKLRIWCAPDFGDALAWVLLAVGLDPTRPALTGLLFDRDRVVASDGHRLHVARIGGLDLPALLPGAALATLLRVLPRAGVLELFTAGEFIVFRCGPWELATKPLDETFPPVDNVIPSELLEKFHTLVDGVLLTAALRRLPRSALGPTHGIRLKVNGAIEVGTTSDSTSGRVTVPVVESSHSGADFCIGVDARYLRDAVADSAEVALRFIGEFDPVIVHPGNGRLAVIMPMRL